jgi:hypothetical protein
MLEYLVAAAAFSALALLIHFVMKRWHRHLRQLADRFDLQRRRRIAGRHAFIVMLVLGVAMSLTIFPLTFCTSVPHVAITIGFALAVVPNLIWWFRRVSALEALGYFRTSSHSTEA